MKQKLHPALGVLAGIVVLLVVGLICMKLFGGQAPADAKTVVGPDRNDPKFQPDSKLSGGGG